MALRIGKHQVPRAFSVVDAEVDPDAEQPGKEPRLPAEAPQALHGPDKRLLREFLGIIVVAHDAEDGIEQPVLMQPHQFAECRHIAAAAALHEQLLGLQFACCLSRTHGIGHLKGPDGSRKNNRRHFPTTAIMADQGSISQWRSGDNTQNG